MSKRHQAPTPKRLPKRQGSTQALRRELARLTDRNAGLIKGSLLSTEAVLEAYETSLVDAGLGD